MIEINKSDGSVVRMSIEEYARWMCLVEGMYFIRKKAKSLGFSENKPIKFNGNLLVEYIHGSETKDIHGRYNGMLHDLKCEYKLGLI